jgi:hypothetical protein
MLLPTAITMFVLIHQRTLQKNYLALRAVTPPQSEPDNWLDVLMQTALHHINAHKPLLAVIEQQDALDTMLNAQLPLQACIKKELLLVLLDSVPADSDQLLWISTHGKIRGINATWNTHADTVPLSPSLPAWQQDALFFTAVTDALVLYAQSEHRSFTIIFKGTIVENMSAHQTQRYIKDCQKSSPASKKGETIHGSYRTQTGPHQHSAS